MAVFQSVKSEKHTVPAEYIQSLKSKLDANSGKLFMVDSSKPRALSALKALLTQEAPSSLIFVVQDKQVALEVESVLGTKNEGVALIKSANDMLSMLEKVGVAKAGITDEKLKSVASSFKQMYPKIIIAAYEGEETVLHKELCKDNSKNGVYNYDTDRVAPYCISNFLSECAYDFAIIDNIYEIISFAEAGREEYKSPRKFEKIDFLGDAYYIDQKKSYKRLKSIVDSAKKCVIISDLIVDKNAVSMYAALHLLHDEFDTIEAKKYIRSQSENIFMECETMCATVSYCKDDENALSMCLQLIKGTKQYVPRDIDSMSKFLEESFRFMTQQEILTKMAYLYAKRRTGLGASVDEVNARLNESLDDVAQCFCDVFFKDTLKGELESAVSTAHLCNMNKDEINRLISVFAKYAMCVDSPSISQSCNIIRIYCESSAFEQIIRKYTPNFDKNAEYSYATSQIGDEAIYKSIAVKDLIEAQTLGVSMKTPALIVANGNSDGICTIIKKLLPSFDCTTDLSVLYSGNKTPQNAIAVIDYDKLRRTARYLNISSVVFFDILPDINLFDSLIKKAIDMGNGVSSVMLTSYTNMSGHMADAWEKSILSSELKVLPMRNSEVYVKGEVADDYSTIVNELEQMYVSFRQLCEGTYDKSLAALASKYHTLVATYTLNVADTEKKMERDFKYFKRISEAYNCIFRNSFSIGSNGEELRICNVELDAEGRSRRRVTEKKDEKDIPSAILFNACAKHMHRTCDIKVNDCGNCPKYKEYLTNNYKLFSAGVVEFFSLTEKIMQDLENERRLDEPGIIYSLGEEETESQLLVHKIRESAKVASQNLMKIGMKVQNAEKLFYAPYDAVEAIQKEVNNIYTSLFGKYYTQLMEIFNSATEKMRKAFTIAGEGASHLKNAL